MILQRLVDTNLLVANEIPSHAWESAVLTLFVSLVSFALFVFWKNKKALINFQAWSLLTSIINIILFFHFSPISIHVMNNGCEYQFTKNVIRMLMFLMFLTSVVTMWKFWKLSEKYIPKDLIYQSRQKNKKRVKNSVSKNVLARSMALWHTVKHGGNDMENDQKMKNKIKKAVKDK